MLSRKSASSLDLIMDRSSSDGAQSVVSGIVVNESMHQTLESQHASTQNDLAKLFRLEDRSIVCRYTLEDYFIIVLTVISDWRTRRTRHRPSTDASAIGCGRNSH